VPHCAECAWSLRAQRHEASSRLPTSGDLPPSIITPPSTASSCPVMKCALRWRGIPAWDEVGHGNRQLPRRAPVNRHYRADLFLHHRTTARRGRGRDDAWRVASPEVGSRLLASCLCARRLHAHQRKWGTCGWSSSTSASGFRGGVVHSVSRQQRCAPAMATPVGLAGLRCIR